MRQSKAKTSTSNKQPYKRRDDRLLLLQRSITDKLAGTKDERLIKLYLQQVSEISKQRLALLKGGVR